MSYNSQLLKKNVEVNILTLEKIHFKIRAITRNKGDIFNDKRSIFQKDLTIINVYTPSIRGP